MGVYLRGKSWYYNFYYEGKRYNGSLGRISKTLAKEKEAKHRMEIREEIRFKNGLPKSLPLLSSELRRIDMKMISPCVYFLVKKREVVYIGQSLNLLRRLAQHGEKDFDEVYYLPVSESEMITTEKVLIRDFNPKLNKIRMEKTTEGGDLSGSLC